MTEPKTTWLNDNQRELIRRIAADAFKQDAGLPDLLAEIDYEVITVLKKDAERRLKKGLPKRT